MRFHTTSSREQSYSGILRFNRGKKSKKATKVYKLGPRTGQDRTIKIRTYVRDQDPKSKKWLCFDPLL